MKNKLNMIRDDNNNFYQNTSLLENAAYAKTLGSFNIYIGLPYIILSAYFAIKVKNIFKTYLFVRQAGYENLDSMEVREWAVRQTENTTWDGTQFVIVTLSFCMLALILWVSFRVKKYELYKRQRRYLLGLFGLALAQTLAAVIIPVLNQHDYVLWTAAVFSWFLHVAILLPQIFGSELFYPLEFKNLSGVLNFLNFLVECFLKRWLEKKRTWKEAAHE